MRSSDWSSDLFSSYLVFTQSPPVSFSINASGRPVGTYPAAQSCPQCPVSQKVPPVIMLKLYEVLTRPEVAAFRAALAAPDDGWIDGAVTAGQQARIVKKNRQLPEQSPLNQRLGQAILQALARHSTFFAAAPARTRGG